MMGGGGPAFSLRLQNASTTVYGILKELWSYYRATKKKDCKSQKPMMEPFGRCERVESYMYSYWNKGRVRLGKVGGNSSRQEEESCT